MTPLNNVFLHKLFLLGSSQEKVTSINFLQVDQRDKSSNGFLINWLRVSLNSDTNEWRALMNEWKGHHLCSCLSTQSVSKLCRQQLCFRVHLFGADNRCRAAAANHPASRQQATPHSLFPLPANEQAASRTTLVTLAPCSSKSKQMLIALQWQADGSIFRAIYSLLHCWFAQCRGECIFKNRIIHWHRLLERASLQINCRWCSESVLLLLHRQASN